MPSSIETNTVLLQEMKDRWLLFRNPIQIITSDSVEDVIPALQKIEKHVNQQGEFAAGFLSYEAAPAFDKALKTHVLSDFPLFWFGLYRAPEIVLSLPTESEIFHLETWKPDTTADSYYSNIQQIKSYLEKGHTYQVNYTLRMHAGFYGNPLGLFKQMIDAQHTMYGAYLDLGQYAICSASPELFFLLDGERLISKPMKGTASRGKTHEEDQIIAKGLQSSIKNRAENIMITDMMRNDMGRIAVPGSVKTLSLFDIEKFPTLWQMTSTVTSQTQAMIENIFRALFPCASVTGAPKPRTMEIVRELESSPRKIYTGAVGMIAPNRQARFNVAIRTVLVDRNRGLAEYGVGGGIVWDSTAEEEFHECEVKARVLTEAKPSFQLLESILWTPDKGYYLLERHLQRLTDSAEYFNYPVDPKLIRQYLERAAINFPNSALKVRLLLDMNGLYRLSFEPPKPSYKITICLTKTPINSNSIYLYHKTTHRMVYENALSEKGEADDVMLWNEHNEITEASSSNIVIKIGKEFLTPPVSCGLLPGTRRAELLDQGKIREAIITKSQLKYSDGIFLINSVRPWREAILLEAV